MPTPMVPMISLVEPPSVSAGISFISLGMLPRDTFWFCYLIVYLLLGPVSCFVPVDLSFRHFSPMSEGNRAGTPETARGFLQGVPPTS